VEPNSCETATPEALTTAAVKMLSLSNMRYLGASSKLSRRFQACRCLSAITPLVQKNTVSSGSVRTFMSR